MPADHEERGIYLVSGAIEVGGEPHDSGRLLVLRPGPEVALAATADTRLMLLGGAPLEGPRFIWWNFVSDSRARIEQAKADWQGGRFAAVPGDDEFIPLPES